MFERVVRKDRPGEEPALIGEVGHAVEFPVGQLHLEHVARKNVVEVVLIGVEEENRWPIGVHGGHEVLDLPNPKCPRNIVAMGQDFENTPIWNGCGTVLDRHSCR